MKVGTYLRKLNDLVKSFPRRPWDNVIDNLSMISNLNRAKVKLLLNKVSSPAT